VSATDETVLGFDYGERRIGVAVGQTVSRTAGPLTTLPAKQGQPDWAALARLVAEWRPERFVVGLPTTVDGAPHPLREAIERFARRLEGRFRRPVVFVDERLSSWAAASAIRGSRHGVDALAAARILETWLDQAGPVPTPQPMEQQ
jgi:putative Holliday junction resolvase